MPPPDDVSRRAHDPPDADEAGNAPQRRHRRVAIPLLVQYRFGPLEEPRFDYALNVSESGLFIAMTESRPLGTRVYVQLTTRDGGHLLQGSGVVVRTQEGGAAIELSGFDEQARGILQRLVDEAMASPRAGLGAADRVRARRSGGAV